MIFGFDKEKIVKLAVENHSYMADGVVQYDYKDHEIFGAPFTTGTVENPANPFIEIYRLPQGEYTEGVCNCYDCPYDDEEFIKKMKEELGSEEFNKLYPGKEECCEDAAFDMLLEYFWDEIDEDYIRGEIRDIIDQQIGDKIDKLEAIYMRISEICDSTTLYQQKLSSCNFIMGVKDDLEDDFYEHGFSENFDENYILAGEIDHVATHFTSILDGVTDWYHDDMENFGESAYQDRVDFIEKYKLREALALLLDAKLDKCLEILNASACYCDDRGRGL